MKLSGKCPKCGANEIRRNEMAMALVGLTFKDGNTIVDPSMSYPVRTYLCRKCGYTEIYNEAWEPDTQLNLFKPGCED
ncbi:MAG: hypothetical protein H0Z39_10180 [Peptococcaceae bacterium]|nr:hypothetical protein [Peptococcaceae bacterium]